MKRNAIRLAQEVLSSRRKRADGGTDEWQSTGKLINEDNSVNWGDPDSSSDFFRADKEDLRRRKEAEREDKLDRSDTTASIPPARTSEGRQMAEARVVPIKPEEPAVEAPAPVVAAAPAPAPAPTPIRPGSLNEDSEYQEPLNDQQRQALALEQWKAAGRSGTPDNPNPAPAPIVQASLTTPTQTATDANRQPLRFAPMPGAEPPAAPVQNQTRADQVWQKMLIQESGNRQFDRNGRLIVSPAGAIGMTQVMPRTGPEAARLAGLPWSLDRLKTDPEYNHALGRAYYDAQLKRFNDPVLAAAAYNGGPGRVAQALRASERTGRPFTDFVKPETRNYVQIVSAAPRRAPLRFGPAEGYEEGGRVGYANEGAVDEPTIQDQPAVYDEMGNVLVPPQAPEGAKESLYDRAMQSIRPPEDSRIWEGMKRGFGDQPLGGYDRPQETEFRKEHPIVTSAYESLMKPASAAFRAPGAILGGLAGAGASAYEAVGAPGGDDRLSPEARTNRLERDLFGLGNVSLIEAGNVRPKAPTHTDAIPRGGDVLPPLARDALPAPERAAPVTIEGNTAASEAPRKALPAPTVVEAAMEKVPERPNPLAEYETIEKFESLNDPAAPAPAPVAANEATDLNRRDFLKNISSMAATAAADSAVPRSLSNLIQNRQVPEGFRPVIEFMFEPIVPHADVLSNMEKFIDQQNQKLVDEGAVSRDDLHFLNNDKKEIINALDEVAKGNPEHKWSSAELANIRETLENKYDVDLGDEHDDLLGGFQKLVRNSINEGIKEKTGKSLSKKDFEGIFGAEPTGNYYESILEGQRNDSPGIDAVQSAVQKAQEVLKPKEPPKPAFSPVNPEGNLNLRPSITVEQLRGPERQTIDSFLSQLKGKPGFTADSIVDIARQFDDPRAVVSKSEFEKAIPASQFEKVDLSQPRNKTEVLPEQFDEIVRGAVEDNIADAYYNYFSDNYGLRLNRNDLVDLAHFNRGDLSFEDLPQQVRDELANGHITTENDLAANLAEAFDEAYNANFEHYANIYEVYDEDNIYNGKYKYEDFQRLVAEPEVNSPGYAEIGVAHPNKRGNYHHYGSYSGDKGLVGHFRRTNLPEGGDLIAGEFGMGDYDNDFKITTPPEFKAKPKSTVIEEIQSDSQQTADQTGPLRQVHGTVFKAAIQDALESGSTTVYIPTAKAIKAVRSLKPDAERTLTKIYDDSIRKEGLQPLSKIPGVTIKKVADGAYHEIDFTPEAVQHILKGPGQRSPGHARGGTVDRAMNVSQFGTDAVQKAVNLARQHRGRPETPRSTS